MIRGPVPCVAAVIPDEHGRVLIIQRQDNGLWALPTGHVEVAEALTAAVQREVLEETGLRVHSPRLTGLYSHPDRQIVALPNGERRHFVTACFLCRLSPGKLRLQAEEVRAAAFLPPADFPEPRVSAHVAWLRTALSDDGIVVD